VNGLFFIVGWLSVVLGCIGFILGVEEFFLNTHTKADLKKNWWYIPAGLFGGLLFPLTLIILMIWYGYIWYSHLPEGN